ARQRSASQDRTEQGKQIRRMSQVRLPARPGLDCPGRRYPVVGPSPTAPSAATAADLGMRLDMDVMDVLFGFDDLASRFAKHAAEFGGRLLPLSPGESLGADDEFAVAGHGD